jgi:two-component system, chemotaxis family, response regulator Rcp1
MTREYFILSIEDNEADFTLLKRAIDTIKNIKIRLKNINSGDKGLDFVFKNKEYKNEPTPDIILLDLNLPVIDGFTILRKIKQDETLKIIPVIIYSTSTEQVDIVASYKFYANSYLSKSFKIDDHYQKITSLCEYWLKTSKLLDNYSIK